MSPYRARFTAREGVVLIGVAQEKMRSFKAHKRPGRGHTPVFDFSRQSVAVNHYYFYVQDREWGPAFLKIGTYLPCPVKLCLNGHEWVKQRLRRNRIRFESLDNGFLSCPDAAVSHHCVLTQEALDRLRRPTVEDGQRVSALRFGDPRAMALFQALCAFTHLPRGFRNRDLRPSVEALLGRPYTTAHMTYDL